MESSAPFFSTLTAYRELTFFDFSLQIVTIICLEKRQEFFPAP